MTRGPRKGRFLALLSIAVALALPFQASAASINASAPSEVTPRDAVGQDSNPRMAEHGGKMHLFWSGNARDGSDFDIVHMAYDGVWSSPEVITASDGTANDHTPFPVSYNGELWVFWSTDNPSVTGGSGSDIACSKLSSSGWSPFQSLTAAYNPSGDYDPKAVVFESKLCVFFESFDSASGVYEIAWTTYSGSGWDAPAALVEGAGTSFNPAPAAVQGGLLLAWESYDPALGGGSGNAVIASKSLSTAGVWSQASVVSGGGPGRNMEPACAAHEDVVWVFWSTNSSDLAGGGDRDIVGRRWSPSGWSPSVEELTPGDSGNDASPSAVSNGDWLVVSWVSDSTEWGAGPDTDAAARILSDDGWSAAMVLSKEDGSTDDGGGNTQKAPAMGVLDGRTFIVWEAGASPDFTQQSAPTWLEYVGISESSGGGASTEVLGAIVLTSVAVIGVGGYAALRHRAKVTAGQRVETRPKRRGKRQR